MPICRGTFEVNMEPEPPFLEQDGVTLNRNAVRKEFSGNMTGTSEAQVLAAMREPLLCSGQRQRVGQSTAGLAA